MKCHGSIRHGPKCHGSNRHSSKRHSSAARLGLAVLAVLVLGGPVAAGEHVSFKGTLDGVVKVTSVDPLLVSVLVNASGNATKLGRFSLVIPHVVDRTTRTATGAFDFKAANGDTLSAEFSGKSAPTTTPGVLSIVETATITGGTGRFAGATGSFTVQRYFDTASRTTTGSFKGTISTTGSVKGTIATTVNAKPTVKAKQGDLR